MRVLSSQEISTVSGGDSAFGDFVWRLLGFKRLDYFFMGLLSEILTPKG